MRPLWVDKNSNSGIYKIYKLFILKLIIQLNIKSSSRTPLAKSFHQKIVYNKICLLLLIGNMLDEIFISVLLNIIS